MPQISPQHAPSADQPPSPRLRVVRHFWRIFRLLSLLAIAIAALAVVLVARGGSGVHIHMLIATALGTGLIVLVGAGLMTLVFLSASSGHDEAAASHRDQGSD